MWITYDLFLGIRLAVWNQPDLTLIFVYFTFMTNLVIVMMEEGLFRGIFLPMSLSVTKTHFWKANILQAFLFGIWHWIWPLKELVSANMTMEEVILYAIIYFIMSFSIAIPWGYYYYKTGSILVSVGSHLIWNTLLGLIPLSQEPFLAYLLAFTSAILIALGTIPIFNNIVPPEYLDEIKPGSRDSI